MSAHDSRLSETKTALLAMTAEAAELQEAVGGKNVTDMVAAWLAPQYARAAREQLAGVEGAERMELLRAFVLDWALLRRGNHMAARLELDREHLAWVRAHREAEKEKEFGKWLKRPEVMRKYFPKKKGGITKRTMRLIQRAMGVSPTPKRCNPADSIRPNPTESDP